jgi:pyruvate kinase
VKDILCTLGPASMTAEVIGRLEELGVTLLRINLSHVALEDVASTIEFIRKHTAIPICLDTEGAQIRTGKFVEGKIVLRENSIVRVHKQHVPGDPTNLSFYPLEIIDRLQVADFISIDFNSVLVQVIGVEPEAAWLRVITGGDIHQNRAVTVEREIALPPLTDKDRAALCIGLDMGVRHYALSFANSAADIAEIRAVVGDDVFVIAKIESRQGLLNLDAIGLRADALLIDRGDLSRQIPLEKIPRTQRWILQRARDLGKKVYVATNLLESMVVTPIPTRAEVNDIYTTLRDGADGLVLAAETAIGSYPVRCVSMIRKMIQQFESDDDDGARYHFDATSLLVLPHGGRLIHREASPADRDRLQRLPALEVSDTDLMDCEQFAFGTYSPLTGFMDRETLHSVLDCHCLPDGTVWTLPLILQVAAAGARGLGRGERVALKSGTTGMVHALLDVTEIVQADLDDIARKWFGTDSVSHPGVARLRRGGDTLLAGEILLVERLPSPHRHFELTPAQSRFIFTQKGWSKVVGFHGRNPAHRAHQFIQIEALKRTGADGLFLSPVVGPKKRGDFLPDPILKSYQLMLQFGLYPTGKVVLGSFSTYSRYSGPREAVFTALCRKNMGCSHFIVGRDHTGVGDFYPPEANRRLFDELGAIGITPVFFGRVGYNPMTRTYEEERDGVQLRALSGTEIRDALRSGRRLPDWLIWTGVQDMLHGELAAGRALFCE